MLPVTDITPAQRAVAEALAARQSASPLGMMPESGGVSPGIALVAQALQPMLAAPVADNPAAGGARYGQQLDQPNWIPPGATMLPNGYLALDRTPSPEWRPGGVNAVMAPRAYPVWDIYNDFVEMLNGWQRGQRQNYDDDVIADFANLYASGDLPREAAQPVLDRFNALRADPANPNYEPYPGSDRPNPLIDHEGQLQLQSMIDEMNAQTGAKP